MEGMKRSQQPDGEIPALVEIKSTGARRQSAFRLQKESDMLAQQVSQAEFHPNATCLPKGEVTFHQFSTLCGCKFLVKGRRKLRPTSSNWTRGELNTFMETDSVGVKCLSGFTVAGNWANTFWKLEPLKQNLDRVWRQSVTGGVAGSYAQRCL